MKYSNPLSKKLWLTTFFTIAVIIGATVFIYLEMKEPLGAFWALTWISTLLVIPGTLPFLVLGYEITDDRIVIRRPFHTNVIRFQTIKKIRQLEDVKKGMVKTFGNGGLFSYAGYYKNTELGLFQSFVNDWERAVLVETPYTKFVISPENPEKFVSEVSPKIPAPGERVY